MLFADAPQSGLQPLDYVMVGVYLLITVGIVLWSSRKQGDTEEFFLGGRRMPWMAVGLSIMATLLSTISYLGLPGEMIKHGIGVFAMYIAFPLSMFVVIPLFIPFFMRLRLTSAYEYLELRFNVWARLLGSVLFFCLRLGWIAMVMYSGSLAISGMTGWDLSRVILWMGLAATAYTFLGGLRAVIWTDVLQAVMLFGGAAVILLYVWYMTGEGPGAWWQVATKQGNTATPWFSIDPTVRITLGTALINSFFWQCCTHVSDQVVLQRYSATPSVAAARNSYIINMVSALAIGILLGLAGLALLFFYTRRPDLLASGMSPKDTGDKLMPYFYAHQLPLGFAGLILANFLCDAMQTLVSGVNSISAVVTKDIFGRLRGNRPTYDSLWTARVLTVGIGLICTFAAIGIATLANPLVSPGDVPKTTASTPEAPPPSVPAAPEKPKAKNIVDLMPRTFNMFLGPLASLFLIGMFIPRATARSALPAVLGALTLSVGWSYAREIFGTPYDMSIQWAIGLPCVTGVVLAVVFSLLLERGTPHSGSDYTWWAVMRRPEPAQEPIAAE